jgi:SulP family sulfate permease
VATLQKIKNNRNKQRMKTKLIALLPFLAWFKTINKNTIKADIIAGFTGAVVVLPQGVAFATIAGLPPEYGLQLKLPHLR